MQYACIQLTCMRIVFKRCLRLSCRSIWEVRRHPPDAMEEKLPGLRVVSAEIETPGHSPRNDASPSLAPAHSGDFFTAALRHHASRLRHAVMSQRVCAKYSATCLRMCDPHWFTQHHPVGNPLGHKPAQDPYARGLRGTDHFLQVNFMDVARNPKLAKAARAELAGGSAAGASPIAGAGAHSAEVRLSSTCPSISRSLPSDLSWGPGTYCVCTCIHACLGSAAHC